MRTSVFRNGSSCAAELDLCDCWEDSCEVLSENWLLRSSLGRGPARRTGSAAGTILDDLLSEAGLLNGLPKLWDLLLGDEGIIIS